MHNSRKLYLIQVLTSVSIWTTLVCCIWNIGYCMNLSPVGLGFMSFCFSGAMALFNGVMSVVLKPTKCAKVIGITALADVLLNILLYFTDQGSKAVFVYLFLISACFSVISIAKDKILATASQKAEEDSEKIFKLLRFAGPIAGGLLSEVLSYRAILLMNAVLLVFAGLISILLDKVTSDTEIEKKETHYIQSRFYERNSRIFFIFLAMTFVITICIQMVDAQLATVFHLVNGATAKHIGLCIGISGIGVFIISCFFEHRFVKESFFYGGIAGMGILMTAAGSYFRQVGSAALLIVFIMFMLGGICWQTVMSTHENLIKSVLDRDKMMRLFSAVGTTIIVSYSAGAVASGFIVEKIGIASMYVVIGLILLFTGIVGGILSRVLFGKKQS